MALGASADVTGPTHDLHERSWKDGDWAVGHNDPLEHLQPLGDVVSLQIQGIGESCMLRKRLFPLRFPAIATYKIRWTQRKYATEHPSLHIVFDPPGLDSAWWKAPIRNYPGQWNEGRTAYVFHYSSNPSWKQCGLSHAVESADQRHEFVSEENKWTTLTIVMNKQSITVLADGKVVSTRNGAWGEYKRFAVGFGDQSSTRVELDELSVRFR